MIFDKIFGVYTSMKSSNATEIDDDYIHTSQIRLGGVNEELIDENKEQVWIHTLTNSSWEIPLEAMDFNYESVSSTKTSALINPGFPLIAAPRSDFDKFREKLSDYLETKQKKLTCTNFGWCYVSEPCSALTDDLPRIAF